MKVITWETLYYEDHGATLKHKCGKRIVTLSLLSFSLIFLFIWAFSLSFYGIFFLFGLLWPLLFIFRPESHPHLWENHSLHHSFLTWDNALKMMIITLLFFLQLNNYNLILRTKYDSIWMPPVVYRDMQCDNDECVMINGTVESCMAIYLGMAMEMP